MASSEELATLISEAKCVECAVPPGLNRALQTYALLVAAGLDGLTVNQLLARPLVRQLGSLPTHTLQAISVDCLRILAGL